MTSISNQDEDGLLKWELDFPSSREEYTAFLRSKINISEDGTVNSMLYQKEFSKNITLHQRSHHPTATKIASIRNNYNDADFFSSNNVNKQTSYDILDKLYINNGYMNPRKSLKKKKKKKTSQINSDRRKSVLKLPFLSDSVSNKVKEFIKQRKLPITAVFIPGKKLRTIFCHSRPKDKRCCHKSNCRTCDALISGNCQTKNTIYQITCLICLLIYIGETLRIIDGRFDEHYKAAANPSCKSYKNKALALHYSEHHPGMAPKLKLEILGTESNTLRRKIVEAMHIMNKNPQINLKSELETLRKYLIDNS